MEAQSRRASLVGIVIVLFLVSLPSIPDQYIPSEDNRADVHRQFTKAVDYTVNITLSIGNTYMMNGYNTTIHCSGVFNETGEQWNGTAAFNTTDTTQYPLYTTYGNRSFTVTSITDPDYGATQFQVVSALPYCLWERATYSQLAWEWITQTGDNESGEDNDVFLYFYLGNLYWSSNDTKIAENTVIQLYVNDTLTDWGYVDAYGRIARAYPHLVAGGFDMSWDYANITVYASDCYLNGTQYDSLMYQYVYEVQHELALNETSTFSDAGAEAVIINTEGQGNLILIAVYTGNSSYIERAPSGVTIYLNITTGSEDSSYDAIRVTDTDGLVTWSINTSFADTLASFSDNFTLYYRTSLTAEWDVINRFASVTMTSPTITAEATEEGVFIDITPDFTVANGTADYGEFAHIVGLLNMYLITIGVYDGVDTWNYTLISDLHRIFLPDIIDEDANYTLTFRQSVQANIIWAQCSFTVECEAKLFITERLFHLGSTELHLSGHVGVVSQSTLNATYMVYEGAFVVGSGWVLGDFDIYWDRDIGTGDRTYGIEFTRGTQTTWVNGTYSKAEDAALSVSVWDLEFDDAYVNVFCITNWANTTLYFYDNDTLMAYSSEAEVIQYRKQGGDGVHVVGVKIDGGGDFEWKNFTYSIAVIVADLHLTVFDWDTGSERLVSCTIETNWGNCSITVTQDGRDTLYSGVETGLGGVSFYFEKSRSETTYIVTLTLDGGAQSLTYTMGYSYSEYDTSSNPTNNPTNDTLYDAVASAIDKKMTGQIVIPPSVLAGLLGLLVIAVAVLIGQTAYSRVKKSRIRRIKSGASLASAFMGG